MHDRINLYIVHYVNTVASPFRLDPYNYYSKRSITINHMKVTNKLNIINVNLPHPTLHQPHHPQPSSV